MSDLLTNEWWETSAFEVLHATKNDGWEDLDGDLELFLAIEEILTSNRRSCWEHERLDWDQRVQKLPREDCFHAWHRTPLEAFDALLLNFRVMRLSQMLDGQKEDATSQCTLKGQPQLELEFLLAATATTS